MTMDRIFRRWIGTQEWLVFLVLDSVNPFWAGTVMFRVCHLKQSVDKIEPNMHSMRYSLYAVTCSAASLLDVVVQLLSTCYKSLLAYELTHASCAIAAGMPLDASDLVCSKLSKQCRFPFCLLLLCRNRRGQNWTLSCLYSLFTLISGVIMDFYDHYSLLTHIEYFALWIIQCWKNFKFIVTKGLQCYNYKLLSNYCFSFTLSFSLLINICLFITPHN